MSLLLRVRALAFSKAVSLAGVTPLSYIQGSLKRFNDVITRKKGQDLSVKEKPLTKVVIIL